MPLISDKDRYKKILRQDSKAFDKSQENPNKLINSNQRINEDVVSRKRRETKQSFSSINESIKSLKIKSTEIVADNYKLVGTLSEGETLIDIMVSSHTVAVANSQRYNIFYTPLPPSELGKLQIDHNTTTVFIVGDSGQDLFLLQSHLVAASPGTNTLRGDNQTTPFVQVEERYYFYVASKPSCTVTFIKK